MGETLPVLCGRDARAPGWAFSHDAGDTNVHNIAEAPGRRSSLKELHPYSCLFVVRLHFQNENGWLFILSILCIHVQ